MKWKKIGNRRTFSESAEEDKSIRKDIEFAYTALVDLQYKLEKSGYVASDDALPRQIRSLVRLMEYYI